MSNPSLVIVLVEDERHRMLIRRYLTIRGLRGDQIRIQQSPSGRGNAEGWVRTRFAVETRVYRKRQARAKSALIVMIDADTHTVQERMNQLAQALKDNKEPALGKNERIARLVPMRNVETWILCLNGEQGVVEDMDYTRERRKWHDLIPPASETLCEWTQSKNAPPGHCVSSLRIGVRELKRLRS
jgi:hypothetical protein